MMNLMIPKPSNQFLVNDYENIDLANAITESL